MSASAPRSASRSRGSRSNRSTYSSSARSIYRCSRTRTSSPALVFLALVAFLAGLYPALVLSAYRPATVTRGGRVSGGPAWVRQVLVVLQFAILIALLISTAVAYRQMHLGMREALRQNVDPILLVRGCNDTLKAEMLRARGVLATACS